MIWRVVVSTDLQVLNIGMELVSNKAEQRLAKKDPRNRPQLIWD